MKNLQQYLKTSSDCNYFELKHAFTDIPELEENLGL
jgi:hypothetical protein